MYWLTKIITISLFLSACGLWGPKLSVQQKRSMQNRTFEDVSYNNVFRAFKSALLDGGYVIINQDMRGGLIVAEAQKGEVTSGFLSMLPSIFTVTSDSDNTGKKFIASVNLEKINKKTVETRLVLRVSTQHKKGGTTGKEILEPKVYKSIYDQVAVEIKRRQAKGR